MTSLLRIRSVGLAKLILLVVVGCHLDTGEKDDRYRLKQDQEENVNTCTAISIEIVDENIGLQS